MVERSEELESGKEGNAILFVLGNPETTITYDDAAPNYTKDSSNW
jgi:hypothetical protein